MNTIFTDYFIAGMILELDEYYIHQLLTDHDGLQAAINQAKQEYLKEKQCVTADDLYDHVEKIYPMNASKITGVCAVNLLMEVCWTNATKIIGVCVDLHNRRVTLI